MRSVARVGIRIVAGVVTLHNPTRPTVMFASGGENCSRAGGGLWAHLRRHIVDIP